MESTFLKLFSLFLLSALIAVPVAAQSSSERPAENKKANKRPSEKPTKIKPKLINEDSIEPSETDDEVLKIETELVTLPVRVLDRQGRFVSGLLKKDFNVFEDKKPQQIEYFSNERSPFTVALVLDMSYSSTFKINEIQQAALTFVNELRPDDKVLVIAFDEAVHVLSEPTSDRKTLEQAIIRTQIGSGTSLYETVDFVINKRLSNLRGRKAIVLFTDGVDTTSRRVHDRENLRDALEFDALIYPIRYDTYKDVKAIQDGKIIIKDTSRQTTPPIGGGQIPSSRTKNPLPFPLPTGTIGTGRSTRRLPGSGTTREEYQRAEEYLDEMARRTGGRVYQANNPVTLTRAFFQIANELREFYSIGYYPDRGEKASSKRRKIKVRVNRKSVAVKTRASYVTGKAKSKNQVN